MNSVIKGASYVLVHTPDMVLYNGTTQTTERIVNPDSEYLKEVPKHLRSYEDAVSYWPNQTYIGNVHPDELAGVEFPWYDKQKEGAARYGKYGEIMPEEEFLFLVQASDMFEVVKLEEGFVAKYKEAFAANPVITEDIAARITDGVKQADIEAWVKDDHAEGLYFENQLVGCIKPAHDIDVNLSAHVMHENLMSKASSVLALLYAVRNAGIERADVEYVIDCAEEACGDMNQRGGGNFAKAAAEVAGLINATGSDVRGFCAAPVHAVIEAAALVKAGAYKTVVVTAGGCTAKLGMNGKDHIKKGIPILEDCLAGFAVVISENDGISTEIDLSMLGRHSVGTGSAPQAVIGSLVAEPLDRAGMKITDIDKFSPEMQNPDITKPAGAGDVPLSNYKMIGALAVKRGEMDRKELAGFTTAHGLTGWAPTQGHIPSGVPYIGFACEDIQSGKIRNAMIIGKGSLFLGRMTNLFDGVSFVMHGNTSEGLETGSLGSRPRIALTGIGSEHGEMNAMEAAAEAAKEGIDVYYIGTLDAGAAEIVSGKAASKAIGKVISVQVEDEESAHKKMEELLKSQEVDGAVTMHYPFPIGVSTVGRTITPGKGREMYVATTTGTSSADRVEGMVKNAVYGIIAAKACGNPSPTVGILNVDGARQTEIALKQLKDNGYDITFAESGRADGGCVMRGNDVLQGSPDIMVCDSLSGNILIKMLSSFTTGGNYESIGYGYGPGIGEGYHQLVMIISRASGAPVIAGAIRYAAQLVRGRIFEVAAKEFSAVNKAGLQEILAARKASDKPVASQEVASAPPKEIVTSQIPGIEIMDLEDGVQTLRKIGIYAESGMGCTGPIILVSDANLEKAQEELKKEGYISVE